MQARLTASFAALLTIEAAAAGDDVVAQRRDLMLMNSHAEDVADRVIVGKYSVEKAIAAVRMLQDNTAVFPTLFPAGSDKGFTDAPPAIWENMDDFKSLAAKLVKDVKAAESAANVGQDAFTLAFQAVETDCKACHSKYDKKIVAQF